MNGDGRVFPRFMTQPEVAHWIRNMEDRMKEHGIEGEYMVPYTLRRITQGAGTWREIHQAIQGWNEANAWEEFKTILLRSRFTQKPGDSKMKQTCACKICGEIAHTQEEHKDGCPHCEENHLAEECPTGQVTCFLCEGTTHYPGQCHIYPRYTKLPSSRK